MGIIKKTAKKSTVKKGSRAQSTPTSMIDALFTSTQQRVLGLIFGQPERKFFATELISLAGKGSGSVQRELVSLVESGLVSVESIGKQKYYIANSASPIFNELCSITIKTMGLLGPLGQALKKFETKIELALVYGSIAKGTAKAGSDVDLLVVSDKVGLEDLYDLLEPVEKQLSRKINPTLYSKTEFAERVRANNPFIQKLLDGEYIQLIGDARAVAQAR